VRREISGAEKKVFPYDLGGYRFPPAPTGSRNQRVRKNQGRGRGNDGRCRGSRPDNKKKASTGKKGMREEYPGLVQRMWTSHTLKSRTFGPGKRDDKSHAGRKGLDGTRKKNSQSGKSIKKEVKLKWRGGRKKNNNNDRSVLRQNVKKDASRKISSVVSYRSTGKRAFSLEGKLNKGEPREIGSAKSGLQGKRSKMQVRVKNSIKGTGK